MKNILTLFALILLFPPLFAQKSENNGWYVQGYTEEIAKAYFDSRYSLDLIEGIWQSNDGFKYSIERDVKNGQRLNDTYRVIILESSSNGWEKTEIKGFITYSSINGIYSLKYYTKSNGKNLSSQNVLMVVEDPLLVSFNRIDGGGEIQLFKLYPKVSNSNEANANSPILPSNKIWTGSSIVIGNKYLATNFHVVDGAKTLVITSAGDNNATEYEVKPIAIDKTNDLAILKVIDDNFKGFGTIPYGMVSSTSDVGTDVFVMGFPLIQAMGSEVKLTTGIISSKTGFQGDVSLYQISAPVQPGNSGGPLFDERGNLIGIVNAGIPNAENVGYAIKLVYLKNLVESCNEHFDINSTNTIYKLPLAEKVKKLNSFVYLVKANSSLKSASSGGSAISSIGVLSSSSQEYFQIAGQMMDDKRYDEAYEYAKKSVEIDANVENHYLRGLLACHYANEFEVAIESMNYCLEKRHRIKECNKILAYSYYGLKRYTDAISVYDKLLSLDRKDVDAIYMRALCKSNLGYVDAAIADYSSALKFEGIVDYDYGTIYNNLAFQYLEQDDFPNAQKNINIALMKNHISGYIWDTYGELMYKQGKFADCVRFMGVAIYCAKGADASWLGNSYYYRGLAWGKLGFDADAYEDITKAQEYGNEKAKITLSNNFHTNNQLSGKYFNIIKNPDVGSCNSKNLMITAIESTEEYTTIHFSCSNIGGGWISINKDTYISEDSSTEKLYLIDVDNIAIYPKKSTYGNEIYSFSLTFPAIDKNCQSINLNEDLGSDGFIITDISLSNSNESLSSKNKQISWEDVAVTDNPQYAEGLEIVETITKTSEWGNAATNLGIQTAIKLLQKEAAKKGCCLIVITNVKAGFTTKVTGTLYRRP